jgi:hypothetical protein
MSFIACILVSTFAKGSETEELFHKIWSGLNIFSWKEIKKIMKKLEKEGRDDLISQIEFCQKHIIIDDKCQYIKEIRNIDRMFPNIEIIDISNEINYDIKIFDEPKVRNVKFTTISFQPQEYIINIFIEHIRKWDWDSKVKIEYHYNDIDLHYDNGYISFNNTYFTIENLSKLCPRGCIPLNNVN